MDINSFQRESWNRFFSSEIHEIFDSFRFDYRGIKIRIKANAEELLSTGRRATGYGETVSGKLKADFTIVSENGQDVASSKKLTGVSLMDIPILTETGFIKGGNKYGIVSNLSPASGWYVEKNKRACELRLKKTAVVKMTVYWDPKVSDMFVKFRDSKSVPILVFLKALTAKNFDDILEDFKFIDIALMCYRHSIESKVEPSAIDCAMQVLAVLGDTTEHKDPVEVLRNRIFDSIIYRVGKEKIRRFGNSQSFLKAVGFSLAVDTVVSGKTIEENTVVTRKIAKALDDSGAKELQIWNGDKSSVYTLYKENITENLSYQEILAAIYNYMLILDGIGDTDNQDNYCNKVLTPVGSYFSKVISDYLDDLDIKLMNKINGNEYYIDSLLDSNMLRAIDRSKQIEESLNTSPQFQMLDEMNSMTVFEQEFRVSCDAQNVPEHTRDVQKSQYGRICPYTTAESRRVGLNTSLSVMANVDSDGFITTPVYQVRDGKAESTPIWISNIDERGYIIAPYDVDLSKCDKEDIVRGCSLNGDQIDAKLLDISYQFVSSAQIMGPLLSYVPFSNHNAGKRLIMGVNTLKQAMPAVIGERPWVSTGVEAAMPIGIIRGRDIIRNALQANGFYNETVDNNAELKLIRMGNVNDLYAFFETDHRLIGINKDTGKKKTITYMVPSMSASVKKTQVHYCLNNHENNIYSMNDVVFYSSDVKVGEKIDIDRESFDSAGIQADPAELETRGLALGNNVRILFKSWEGFGYEDSIIINEEFANLYGLSTIQLMKKYSVAEDDQVFTNRISDNSINAAYLDYRGLPNLGVHLRVGEVVIGKVTERETASGTKQINSCEKIETGEDGIVIHASIERNSKGQNEAVVVMGTVLKAGVGDKLSGMHGNKGVIGKVVPKDQLPFTADGEVPDIILNPLGIIARANVGQLVEILVSSLGKAKNEIQIAAPFSQLNVGEVLSEAESYGLREKVLYDPRTGRSFPRKALMGYMHMLRSSHTSTGKYNATGICLDNVNQKTGQPNRGRGGGQRISEMATWCYNSLGAVTVLDNLFTVQSDDSGAKHELNRRLKQGELAPKLNIHSQNANILEGYFRTLGVNIVADGDSAWLEPINSEKAKALAVGMVNFELEQKDILRDPKIFGMDSNYVKHIEDSKKRYGGLPLGCEVVMPILLSPRFLEMFICRRYVKDGEVEEFHLTEPKLKDIISKRAMFKFDDPSGLPVLVYYPNPPKNDIKFESHTGICGIVAMIKRYDLNWTLDIINRRLGFEEGVDEEEWFDGLDRGDKKVAKDLKIRASVMQFMRSNSLSDFITDTVLVPPIVYRPKYKDNTTTALDDQLYRILSQAITVRKWDKDNVSYYSASNYMFVLLQDMLMQDPRSRKKTIWQELADHETKHSIIRDVTLSKRVGFSGRSVICVDSKLHINEAGIPVSIITDILGQQLTQMIMKDTHGRLGTLSYVSTEPEDRAREIKRMLVMLANENISGFRKYTYEIEDPFLDVLEACKEDLINKIEILRKIYPYILSREPCLHMFNTMGFYCVPVWGYAIHLHPLACKAFNADFDGDQMSVTIPQTEDAIKEVKSRMMQSQNLINPKDASPIMDINQDMILGIYCATKNPENDKVDFIYSIDKIGSKFEGMKNESFALLWNLVESGELEETSRIILKIGERLYNNSCGRILFNSLFPDGFGFTDELDGRYCKLRFDQLIRSSNMKKISASVIEKFQEDSCIQTLDRLKDFGFYFADNSGITLSVYDFANISNVKVKSEIEETNEFVKEIEHYYECGFLTDSERHRQLTSRWDKAKKESISLLMDEIDKNSNIFCIVDSGSRGSPSNLCEMMGMVGSVINAKNEVLDVPIRSNYLEGLNAIESFSNSYNSRRVTVATQLGSPVAGEMAREFVYLNEHLRIANEDTHCDAPPTRILLDYTLACDDFVGSTLEFEEIPDNVFDPERLEKWKYLGKMLTKIKQPFDLNEQSKLYLTVNGFECIVVRDSQGVKTLPLRYKLTEISRNLLWLRSFEPSRIPKDIREEIVKTSEISTDYIVSHKTIDLVEKYRLTEFYIYTILGCMAEDSICKRCFGLKYDTRRFPEDMETVGFQGAQAISEPTSQLILDTHKKSNSSVNGLSIVNNLLSGPLKAHLDQTIAMENCVAHIDVTPEGYAITWGGSACVRPNLEGVRVYDGMPVKKGTVVYGKPNYASLISCNMYDAAIVELWKEYLQAYDVGILARNFELTVRAQSEFGVAKKTDLSNGVISGETYYVSKLRKFGVPYEPCTLGAKACFNASEKVFAAIAKGDGKDKIGTFTMFRTKNRKSSVLSGAVLGVLRSRQQKLKIGQVSEKSELHKEEATHVIDTKVSITDSKVVTGTSIFNRRRKPVVESVVSAKELRDLPDKIEHTQNSDEESTNLFGVGG